MIVRILGEGQWEIDESSAAELNSLDNEVESAVNDDDEERFERALHSLLEQVRSSGTRVPDGELEDSDLILPAADATIADVRELLSGSDEGLVPN